MAILNIVKVGDPVLRKTCRPIDNISGRIKRLAEDMVDTLHKAEGAGLAAPQVGVLRRMVVVEVEEGKTYVMINPEIVSRDGRQRAVEGCLSIPGEWGVTDRPETVTVSFTDLDGETQTVTFQATPGYPNTTDDAIMLDKEEIEQLEEGEFDPEEKIRRAEEKND